MNAEQLSVVEDVRRRAGLYRDMTLRGCLQQAADPFTVVTLSLAMAAAAMEKTCEHHPEIFAEYQRTLEMIQQLMAAAVVRRDATEN